jgi:hypothetical protein
MSENSSYMLSKGEKEEILSADDNMKETDNDNRYEHNTGWISEIHLPTSKSKDIPIDGNEIAVKVLKNNEDTFWEIYNISESYISQNSNFADIMRWTGNNIDNIESALGSEVNIVFNKPENEWKIDPDIYSNNSSDTNVIKINDIIKYLLIGFLFIIFMIIILFGLYRIQKRLNNS